MKLLYLESEGFCLDHDTATRIYSRIVKCLPIDSGPELFKGSQLKIYRIRQLGTCTPMYERRAYFCTTKKRVF